MVGKDASMNTRIGCSRTYATASEQEPEPQKSHIVNTVTDLMAWNHDCIRQQPTRRLARPKAT